VRASYDVAIVGGGVIGSSIAYHLAAEPAFGGSILVVERDPSYADGSTARSAGAIRQQFSTPENIAMSRFGIGFMREAGERLAVDGEAAEIGLVESAYLFLASAAGVAVLRANHAVQTENGARVALLSPDELAARFPWIRTDGVAGAALGLADEGWLDPYALLQAFRRKARSLGAEYVPDEAVGIAVEDGRVARLQLAGGGTVACGALIDAAGPRAAAVAAMAGLELPVRPRKRIVYVVDCRQEIAGLPLLIDTNGVWVRPEGGQFICGVSPPEDEDPDCLDLEIDDRFFEETVWPTLARRVPAFEAIKLVRAWAGHYAMNTVDQNAILGPHPELANFYFANGFSGHGLQQSPAVGRGIAEIIAFGAYRTLDLSRFGYGRFAEGRPIRENAIV
jgi:glycine/D-amino acid oxidase-like deaminating enzyme